MRAEASEHVSGRAVPDPLRWLERALWLLGCLGVGWVLVVQLESRAFQAREEARLERALSERGAGRTAVRAGGGPAALRELPGEEGAEVSGEQAGEETAGAEGAQPAVPPGTMIGRLEVPRLDLAAIVASGIDSRTLRRAIGHIPATALPGEPGNVGIAGHRDRFFRGLKDVRTDDEIVFTTPDGTFRYRVEWTQVVEPADVHVLDDAAGPTLTLVTCYPFYYVGPAPERFIVRARQVRHEPAWVAP